MNKIKLTNHQIFVLTAGFATSGSGIIIISSSISGIAKQDAWISALVTLVFSIFYLILISLLWSQYPNNTYIKTIESILGNKLGLIVGAIFTIASFLSIPQICWNVSSLINIENMPETPAYIIDMVFVIVIVIALLYGLEAIARSYEILLYFMAILFILSMILVFPKAKIENLQPVFENGIGAILRGALILSAYTVSPSVELLMIYPVNIINIKKAKKSFFIGHIFGELLVFISIIMSTLVLGSGVTADAKYPIYMLAQQINVGSVITRVESLDIIVWIIASLTRAIIYFYAAVIGISDILGLKDYKKIVIPLGFIILVMSQITYPDGIYQLNWNRVVWPPFVTTFGIALPLTLVIVFGVKKYILKMNVR